MLLTVLLGWLFGLLAGRLRLIAAGGLVMK
jgi:hypothetical protein